MNVADKNAIVRLYADYCKRRNKRLIISELMLPDAYYVLSRDVDNNVKEFCSYTLNEGRCVLLHLCCSQDLIMYVIRSLPNETNISASISQDEMDILSSSGFSIVKSKFVLKNEGRDTDLVIPMFLTTNNDIDIDKVMASNNRIIKQHCRACRKPHPSMSVSQKQCINQMMRKQGLNPALLNNHMGTIMKAATELEKGGDPLSVIRKRRVE